MADCIGFSPIIANIEIHRKSMNIFEASIGFFLGILVACHFFWTGCQMVTALSRCCNRVGVAQLRAKDLRDRAILPRVVTGTLLDFCHVAYRRVPSASKFLENNGHGYPS